MASRLPVSFDQEQNFYTSTTSDQAIMPFTIAPAQPMPDFLSNQSFDALDPDNLDLFTASDQMDQTLQQSVFDSSWPASPENNFIANPGYSPLATNDSIGLSTNSQQNMEDAPLFMPESSTDGVSKDSQAYERPQPTEHNAQPLPSLQPRPPGSSKQTTTKAEPAEPSGRRMAHNLVERKYRDTLNTELERLRRTVPSIRNLDSETPDGRPRASKATVLSAATEYIKKLEVEVDGLAAEIERLSEACGRPARRRRQGN